MGILVKSFVAALLGLIAILIVAEAFIPTLQQVVEEERLAKSQKANLQNN
ncbi:hypothetical protein [Parapedomonas caeni]